MAQFIVYPTPVDSRVTLSPDSQGSITGAAYTAPDGRQGQVLQVAESIPSGHGATIEVAKDGYQTLRLRGFLVHDAAIARLQVDDYVLSEVVLAPPPDGGGTPPPTGPRTPIEIMDEVFRTTNPNLATVAGCGKYTEDCCDALHNEHSPMWGHISKTEGQNQFNGHAVDALMLLANVSSPSGGTTAGVYDIIFSSASLEAKPSFNYAHPPQYELWYYPADALTMGVSLFAIPALRRRPMAKRK